MAGFVATIYVFKKTLPWFVIGLSGASFLFLVSQLMRIAPVFAGANLGFFKTAWALFLLLVPVVGWALAPAMLFALFITAGELSENGELLGFFALGISRRNILKSLILFSLFISSGSALIWLFGAPRGTWALSRLAKVACTHSLINEIEAGQIISPVQGLTFFAEKSEGPAKFGSVFVAVENGNQRQEIVADSVRITNEADNSLSLHFKQGHLFVTSDQTTHSPTRIVITFDSFVISHPLSDTIAQRLDFIPSHLGADLADLTGPAPPGLETKIWRFNLWRRIAMPLGCLALSLIGIVWAFSTNWRTRGEAVTVALMLFTAYHLLARWGETLMQSGDLTPPIAACWPLALTPIYAGVHIGLSKGIHALRMRVKL